MTAFMNGLVCSASLNNEQIRRETVQVTNEINGDVVQYRLLGGMNEALLYSHERKGERYNREEPFQTSKEMV